MLGTHMVGASAAGYKLLFANTVSQAGRSCGRESHAGQRAGFVESLPGTSRLTDLQLLLVRAILPCVDKTKCAPSSCFIEQLWWTASWLAGLAFQSLSEASSRRDRSVRPGDQILQAEPT